MAQEDLILLEETPKEKEELEIIPDFDAAYSDRSIRPQPSTTEHKEPDLAPDFDLAPHLELIPIPGAERKETDDQLFRRIEEDVVYWPTDEELDKYLEHKSRQPKYALDLIKGAWHGGKAVVSDLAKGVWGAVKDPLLFSPAPVGISKRATTLAEGAARATWDLGTVGRYINDWFGEQGDLEYQEEVEDMKLRHSNPDWKMRGAMGGEAYLTKEQKERMRTTWATSYIKERIKEDLEDLETATDNFTLPVKDLQRRFKEKGLTYVVPDQVPGGAGTRDFYTSAEYIDGVLSPKQREKYYKEFPKWINKRQRDRWRRGRYLMRTTELARRGEKTILGELFGPEVDKVAKAYVNSDVATLASYAGGPAEGAAVFSTKLARKSASPSAWAGKATEVAGKGTQWAGEKVQQLGEWATTSPEKSAAVGAALGAAAGDDGITVAAGIFGGLAEQRVRVTPKLGELLQKGGTALEAVGEVVAKPEGVEGILKSASRVAKDEDVALTLNRLSLLDPAINFAVDLGKGTAVGGVTGFGLTLPSGDPGVIGSGLGAGATGGFFAAIPGRYLTRGAKLKEQLRNEWGAFQKLLTPEQLNNIKQYAPTLEEMGNVMATVRMLNGVTRGGGNMDFKFLSPEDFIKAHGVQRGVVVTRNKTRPSVEINIGYKGPHALYHEAWHALKRFAGETELQRTPEGKQEVEVLKPYLDQIQTILFGKRLGGKTVSEGMFSEKDLVGGYYDQYTSKMAPEERKAFERQFQYDESGKELTPAEANQRKLNYMMEEVEAESFRYLMSRTNPRKITQGDRSLHQRFIDHMLLSEHSKTLRGMRKALEVVGINFKPTGEPSDIFVQKGKGITNSRELNAALRQYLRAWEGMQYRTRVMGELEPSGFSIGGTGKAGRAQVEYHLSKKENDFLRDHFSSSDMLKKDKDGGVYFDPDGRVVLLTEGEIKKLQENRAELIRGALAETDDGTGMVLKENGAFEGIPSPHQLDAIDRISGEIITPNQKQIIRETADIMRNDPGAPIQFLYNAALGKGKTYSSSLSSTHRTAVPIGFHISKAQNFYFTALDLGAYHRKISAWGDPTKKALHKGGHKLALWDKDVRAFEADLFKYLENHKYDRPGDTGLDPSPQRAEQKRNVLNDFFNINKGEEGVTEGNFNPVAAARRAIDPKTGKQKKRAYRGLENLLRSYRLDRVLDENFGKSMSYALGRAVPMKSGADFYQKQLKNLMPAPGEDMVAVHNLSADNLRHSLKMGGIPSPSLAIVDVAKGDFRGFGEITLVASKDMVDPKKGAKVFGSDVYAPRYPEITTEISAKTGSKMKEYLKPYEDLGEKVSGFSFRDLAVKAEDSGWTRAAADHNGLQAAFLKEKGLLPDLDAEVAKETDSYWKGRAAQKVIQDAVRKPEVQQEFKNWIEDLPEREGWQFEEKIFRGYTPMGSRRYQPHTLDNVVKILKRNIRGGEGWNYGAGNVRAKVSPQFKSLSGIKKRRGKLTDPELMQKVKEEANAELLELQAELEPHLKAGMKNDNPFMESDIFGLRLQEAAERGVGSLREYYDEGVPLEKAADFLNKLKELPTGYFEAKIPRAVQLQEFEAAIIPSDLDPKLKKVLQERGLELREYDREGTAESYKSEAEAKGTRRRALQQQTEEAGLRFMPAPGEVPKGKKRLFNASTIERPAEYLDPHISDWVKEVAEGAGDVDPAEITSPLIYLSDDPGGWVSIIVSRKLGKPLQKVTVEDIRKHGRLNIVEANEDAPIYKVGDQWETDEVTDLAGNRMKFYESALYSEGDVFTGEGKLTEMPVGPEPPDFITNEAVRVDYSLTGDDLVRFLRENKKLKGGSEDDTPRFMPAPTFYSKAERAVEGAKGGVFDKSGMTTIDKAISLFVKEKKGDKQWQVPEAEVEWSGVVDWLEGRKEEGEASAKAAKAVVDQYERQAAGEDVGIDYVTRDDYLKAEKALIEAEAQAAGKVSKAELLEFLQNKGVKVEEVARGRPQTELKKMSDSQMKNLPLSVRGGLESHYSVYRADDPDGAEYGALGQISEYTPKPENEFGGRYRATVAWAGIGPTRFKTLAEAKDYITKRAEKGWEGKSFSDKTLFKPGESDWVMLPGDEKARQSYGELVLTLPKDRAKSHETFELPSSHRFPESNILAHIRFTERIDADGKKMLFLEELQSDWSGEGRDRGWAKERPPKVQKEILRLRDEIKDLVEGGRGFNHPDVEAAETKIRNLKFSYPHNIGVPDMPFKGDNRYGALALKRMIRWASDNGFDRLGWITGKDTAERYNLSKHIDRVELVDLPRGEGEADFNDLFNLVAYDIEGGRVLYKTVDESGVESHLGKGVAKKLLESDRLDSKTPGGKVIPKSLRKLSGVDLDISPEWPINLYDKVLPTQAKKIVKKKGAVGRTRLGEDTGGKKSKQLDQSIKQIEDELRQRTDMLESVQKKRSSESKRTLEEWEELDKNIRYLNREILLGNNELKELRAQKEELKSPEANYVDITPDVKALAEEGFSYFMPAGVGRGRATVPAQPTAPTLPATPIMPRVKLTEEEKEDSRRLLNLLKKEGI